MHTEPIEEPASPARESGAQKKQRLRVASPATPEGRVRRGKPRADETATYAAERVAAREAAP